MDLGDRDFRHFWRGLLQAVDTTPRDVEAIRGASGLSHRVVACGVDDAAHRLVVISAEADARSAALAQADIQAAVGKVQVLVARPILVSLPDMAKTAGEMIGRPEIKIDPREGQTQEEAQKALEPYLVPISLRC